MEISRGIQTSNGSKSRTGTTMNTLEFIQWIGETRSTFTHIIFMECPKNTVNSES